MMEKMVDRSSIVKIQLASLASKRLVGLDVFRILLAILVLAFHSATHFQCNY